MKAIRYRGGGDKHSSLALFSSATLECVRMTHEEAREREKPLAQNFAITPSRSFLHTHPLPSLTLLPPPAPSAVWRNG